MAAPVLFARQRHARRAARFGSSSPVPRSPRLRYPMRAEYLLSDVEQDVSALLLRTVWRFASAIRHFSPPKGQRRSKHPQEHQRRAEQTVADSAVVVGERDG